MSSATLARHPWWAAIVVLAITGLLGYAALDVGVHYEMEDFFPTDTPERRSFDRIRAAFGPDDRTALVILESPSVLDTADFRAIDGLTQSLEELALLEEVVSPSNAQIVVRRGDDELTLEAAVPAAKLSSERLALAMESFTRPPFAGLLMARDFKVATIRCVMPAERTSSEDRKALLAELERLTGEFASSSGLKVRLAGYPIQRVMLSRAISDEGGRLYPWVLAAMLLVLGGALRSGVRALFPLSVALLASVWTTGLMALWDLPPNILGPAVYILIVVVGVSDGVHMLARYRKLRATSAVDPALRGTLRELAAPCLLTSLTTAVGFAALMLTGIPLVADFGVQVAVGVLAAYLVTLLLLPAFLKLTDRAATTVAAPISRGLLSGLLDRVEAQVRRRPRTLVLACLLLLAVCALGILRLRVNSPLLADLDPEHPIRQTNRFVEERLSGVILLDLIVEPSPGEDPYSQAAVERMERLASRLQGELDGVLLASSVADLLHQMRPLLKGVPDAAITGLLPTALLLAEKQTRRWIHFDSDLARVRVLIRDLPTQDALELFEQIGTIYAAEIGQPLNGRLTGQGYLGQIVNLRIVDHFQTSFLVALGAVFLLLLPGLRSFRLALLSVLANLFPVVAVAGIMGWLGIELRYTSALVLSVIFGLAVDDTIHFLSQWRACPRGADPLRYTFRRAGPGIVLTSLVLVAGFGVLLAGDFVPNRVLGILLCLTAVTAVLADLVLLPSLLQIGLQSRPGAPVPPPGHAAGMRR